jgi:CheY-like chemotaxis protein
MARAPIAETWGRCSPIHMDHAVLGTFSMGPGATSIRRGASGCAFGTQSALMDHRNYRGNRQLMTSNNTRTISILVVEDDVAVAELIRTLLNDVPGWGATVVHDAAAARQVFQVVRIEALVIDVNLPGISGIELIELLRKDAAWNEPPILLMSADPSQSKINDALRTGLVTDFLAKPFDVDQLAAMLKDALEANSSERRS